MMTSFTPGPWEARLEHLRGGAFWMLYFPAGAADDLGLHVDNNGYADMHLIAAAPDLYSALETVMGWIANWHPNFADDEGWPADRAKAKAALAKAEGKPVLPVVEG